MTGEGLLNEANTGTENSGKTEVGSRKKEEQG